MNFGQALEALKNGEMVQRQGWNKGIFIYKTVGNTVDVEKTPIQKFASLPQSVKDFLERRGGNVEFHSQLTMYTAQGTMQPGWLASQADMLADDWTGIEYS